MNEIEKILPDKFEKKVETELHISNDYMHQTNKTNKQIGSNIQTKSVIYFNLMFYTLLNFPFNGLLITYNIL